MPLKKKGTLYFVNRLNEEPITRPDFGDEFIVVSVDPGTKNFALLVEKRRISADGTTTTASAVFLDKWDLNPVLKVKEKQVYGYHEKSTTKSCFNIQDEVRIYYNLTNKLNTVREYIREARYIMVERQLPINYHPVRMQQHFLTYVMMTVADLETKPIFLEVESRLKTLTLKKKEKGQDTKEWAEERAKEMNEERDDQLAICAIDACKKKDDLSDVIVQSQALFEHLIGKKFFGGDDITGTVTSTK